MCGRVFNIKVPVLSCPTLRGKHCTAVNLLKITIRKLVSPLGIFICLIVNPQMPLPVLGEPLRIDELVFFFAWMVGVYSTRLCRPTITFLACTIFWHARMQSCSVLLP